MSRFGLRRRLAASHGSRRGLLAAALIAITVMAVLLAVGPVHLLHGARENGAGSQNPVGNVATNGRSGHAAVVMADGDAGRTGRYQASGVPDFPRVRWRFPHGPFFSSPVVAAGVVYVGGTDGNVYAIDAGSGRERWHVATGSAIHSSAAVADGVVYIGSDNGHLYAIDTTTGQTRWRVRLGDRVPSSPVVDPDVIYISSINGAHEVGDRAGYLYAINTADGRIRWRIALGAWGPSAPAMLAGTVYVGAADGELYAIDAASGHPRWRVNTGDGVSSGPAVARGIVYVGSVVNAIEGRFSALDAANGRELWRFDPWAQDPRLLAGGHRRSGVPGCLEWALCP